MLMRAAVWEEETEDRCVGWRGEDEGHLRCEEGEEEDVPPLLGLK